MIKTDQSSISGSFTPSQFEVLPIGRGVVNMMKPVPGIQANLQGIVVGNVNGSRDTRTDFKIDGMPATNANNGLVTTYPMLELVEELAVQTANYSAEFGRGASQVNMTTRAGTNRVRGTLFHYFQNDALNANSYVNNIYGLRKPVVRQNLFGGTIGGPVVRRRSATDEIERSFPSATKDFAARIRACSSRRCRCRQCGAATLLDKLLFTILRARGRWAAGLRARRFPAI